MRSRSPASHVRHPLVIHTHSFSSTQPPLRRLHTPWYPPRPDEPPLRFPFISPTISLFRYQAGGVEEELAEWRKNGSVIVAHSLSETLPTAHTCLVLLRRYFGRMSAARTLNALDSLHGASDEALKELIELQRPLCLDSVDAADLLRWEIKLAELELQCRGEADPVNAALRRHIDVSKNRVSTLEAIAAVAKPMLGPLTEWTRIGMGHVTDFLSELCLEITFGLAIRAIFVGMIILYFYVAFERDENIRKTSLDRERKGKPKIPIHDD